MQFISVDCYFHCFDCFFTVTLLSLVNQVHQLIQSQLCFFSSDFFVNTQNSKMDCSVFIGRKHVIHTTNPFVFLPFCSPFVLSCCNLVTIQLSSSFIELFKVLPCLSSLLHLASTQSTLFLQIKT